MKILIYSIFFSPELIGIGKFTGEMATWLAGQGHSIKVITTPPYYPNWRVFPSYKRFWYQKEKVSINLSVLRCPIWVPRRPTGLKRILYLLSFAVSSFFPVIWQGLKSYDSVIVIEPPLFCAPAALIMARLTKAKAILHVQDFEVDAAFHLGLLHSNRLKKIITEFESRIMQRFNIVSTISPNMLRRLIQRNVNRKKCVLFPNWVDTQAIYPLEHKSQFRTTWKLPHDKIVLLYSGNIGAKQGLEYMIEAARLLLPYQRIIFVICGTGAMFPQLRKVSEGVGNIVWHNLQPMDKLNELLNLADIHLLIQRADAADLVMPSKLTGMLASGKPIIATSMPGTQVAEVVQNNGIVVPPESTNALVEAIKNLVDNPEKRVEYGRNARHYALLHLKKDAILTTFKNQVLLKEPLK